MYRLRLTGSKTSLPHGAPLDTLSCPAALAAFVHTSPPTGSVGPVEPGEERICGPAGIWRYVKKSVLSSALPVAPSSIAYHSRSTPTSWAASAFLRHVLPRSFETAVLTFVRPSRSVKYA